MVEIVLTCKVCDVVERWPVNLNALDDLAEELSNSDWVDENGVAYCGGCYERMQGGPAVMTEFQPYTPVSGNLVIPINVSVTSCRGCPAFVDGDDFGYCGAVDTLRICKGSEIRPDCPIRRVG